MGQILRPWKTVLNIELNSDKAIYLQIADALIEEIKRGRLKPGTALPGTRPLAEELNVNRKTIVLAFDELIAAGWLTSILKKGTFVSDKLPLKNNLFRNKNIKENAVPNYSFNTPVANEITFIQTKTNIIAFDDGLPDVRLAPMNELARSYKRIFQQSTRWRMMGYGNPKGCDRIRNAISNMLMHDRGLNVNPENICVTRGSQMALFLTANALITKGDSIAVEDPGYAPAWNIFKRCGAKLVPIKVDSGGICVDTIEQVCKKKKLKAVYVTPHHQFPTTVTMKIDRRLKLLDLSKQYGFAIIEDDYDHEFHFRMQNQPPLASHGNAANVIYISSLSKIIAPAVRVGYIIASPEFIMAVAAIRKIVDVQGDSVMEHAVAELMEEGAIRKHSRKAHHIYKERRETMNKMLSIYLKDKINYFIPEGGLAYWVSLNKPVNTKQLAARLEKKGVSILATEDFSFRGNALNALRLGYASLIAEELEKGLAIIGKEL